MNEKTKQLITSAQRGDRESFHQLVALHDERVMTLAFQLTKNQHDAEDIYQEVFIKAWKSIKSFRLESEFFTWLYRITVNTFLNYQRKVSKMKIHDPGNDTDFDPLDWAPAPGESKKESEEISSAVQNAVNKLPDKQKTAFILKHLQNLKIREIANIMAITEGTVKKYLFRAMEKMRVELKEYRYA